MLHTYHKGRVYFGCWAHWSVLARFRWSRDVCANFNIFVANIKYELFEKRVEKRNDCVLRTNKFDVIQIENTPKEIAELDIEAPQSKAKWTHVHFLLLTF